MKNILFVCHGNICRSVMAQWIFQDMADRRGLGTQFNVDSAAASREEIGNPIYPQAARKLREKGIPYGEHFARQITPGDYSEYDLILIMDDRNRRSLGRIMPDDPAAKIRTLLSFAGSGGEVADPWYTGDFEQAFQDISRGCEALLEYLTWGKND